MPLPLPMAFATNKIPSVDMEFSICGKSYDSKGRARD